MGRGHLPTTQNYISLSRLEMGSRVSRLVSLHRSPIQLIVLIRHFMVYATGVWRSSGEEAAQAVKALLATRY